MHAAASDASASCTPMFVIQRHRYREALDDARHEMVHGMNGSGNTLVDDAREAGAENTVARGSVVLHLPT